MLLANGAVPVPLFILVAKAIVGPVEVLQQIPFAVIEAPPSLEIVPPELAVVVVIAVAAAVVRVGTMDNALNVI